MIAVDGGGGDGAARTECRRPHMGSDAGSHLTGVNHLSTRSR